MVLSPAQGGARGGAPRCGDERGAQTLELALVLPVVVVAVTLLVHGALLAADVVTARGVAFQAARVAAVDDDAAVHRAVTAAARRRPVEVDIDPPDIRRRAGDQVTARVRLRSAAFAPFGSTLWIPASVVMRVERP